MALRSEQRALGLGQARPDRLLGEVGRRGDADEARHPLRQRPGEEQGDPAAHGGADEHLRAARQRLHRIARVLRPVADRAVVEAARGLAMAGIIEAEERAAPPLRPAGQMRRLGAPHVAAKAAQEHHPGPTAWKALVGDAAAGRRVEELRHGAAA